jgi:selenocysteine lyase/cysteine desulfurase
MATKRSTSSPGPVFSRRDFTRLFALGGSAALVGHPALALSRVPPVVPVPVGASDDRWADVRAQFLMPPEVAVFNAANLCPSPVPVLTALDDYTRKLDRVPSPAFRGEMHDVKEKTRSLLAAMLRATPEEIVLTRNTSEANNFVSSGLDLGSGDDVIVFADNHPSNHLAWREKARRFGYAVRVVDQPCPHPGAGYYLDAVRKLLTPRTRVLAFSHVTNTVGDVMPAKALCALAREHGVLSLVDGAQSLGVLDVDLRDMGADFFTGSAHKWPCGPKETGVLYVRAEAQPRLSPSVISLYAGATGLSRTFEGLGQRDEPALLAFGEAVRFQTTVGLAAIEARARELGQACLDGLRKIEGVTVWTHADPARSTSVVSFKPGDLDPARLATTLFERDGIICAARPGPDRGGLRFSPHFYNAHAEVDRALGAVRRYMKSGV